MSRTLLILAAVALAGQHTQAQDAVTLEYAPQIQKGTVYRAEIEVKSDQTLTIAGMPLETHADTFMVMREKAVEPSSEGGWRFDGDFELMQSDLDLPGGMKVSFNSNNPDQAEGEGPLAMFTTALKATAGAKWTSETNGDHQVVKMEYVGDPFADVDPLLKGDSDPESIQKSREIEFKRYPEDGVKPGETWTRVEESDLGGGQTITYEQEYKYVGSEERDGRTFDKISVKALTAEYQMDAAASGPAQVTDSDLEVADSEGTLWYDRDAKMFTEIKQTVHMKGSLTLEINDQKLPGELDLTISVSTKSKMISPN